MLLRRSYSVGKHVAYTRGPAFIVVCRCVCVTLQLHRRNAVTKQIMLELKLTDVEEQFIFLKELHRREERRHPCSFLQLKNGGESVDVTRQTNLSGLQRLDVSSIFWGGAGQGTA